MTERTNEIIDRINAKSAALPMGAEFSGVQKRVILAVIKSLLTRRNRSG